MVGHHCVPSYLHDCQDSDYPACLLRVAQNYSQRKNIFCSVGLQAQHLYVTCYLLGTPT